MSILVAENPNCRPRKSKANLRVYMNGKEG